jgi:sugar/nucleoside kinase (ribokinase family)
VRSAARARPVARLRVPTLVAVGKATQDVFMRSPTLFEPHEHDGVLYEQLPLGEKLELDEVIFETGGNVANAATTFARQGLRAEFVWILGTDISSRAILDALDSEGIGTSHVVRNGAYSASYSAILLAESGERTILNYRGTLPTAGQLDLSPIASADWVYLSSLGDMAVLDSTLCAAVDGGAKVMLNPAASELREPPELMGLLEKVEVLAVNKEEAQLLVRGHAATDLARRLASYCPVVIVSDGPNGAVTTDGTTIIESGLYEDAPIVDRTGCGDAFGSGFLSQWAQGRTLRESVVFASANSTSVVGQIGAKAGILRKGAVLHEMPIREKPF